MIDYIKGQIIELTPTELILECGGIGYSILISLQTYEKMQLQTQTVAYIHHYIREDEELFYGFATKDERELFRLLIGVSGIGVNSARMMLSSLTSDEIRNAILAEDINRIKSVKGIGRSSKAPAPIHPRSSRPIQTLWSMRPRRPWSCSASPKPTSTKSCRPSSKTTLAPKSKTSSKRPSNGCNLTQTVCATLLFAK